MFLYRSSRAQNININDTIDKIINAPRILCGIINDAKLDNEMKVFNNTKNMA